jgi:CDP-glucose 4,6-dehydratase
MENLVVKLFNNVYEGKRVLVTGHSGFKGSWLTYWLSELGAVVSGASLPFTEFSDHWELLRSECSVDESEIDIRNFDQLNDLLQRTQPEIIFHLAAQPLVQQGYLAPLETWSTNVMGTVNLLEACRSLPSLQALVVVTTDKCYTNKEWVWGYRETDRIGGHDPYSASKSAVELAVNSYNKAFFCGEKSTLIATARAGNVIGGGDWADGRLLPDVIKAIMVDGSIEIRSITAVRPWHHVLDCLSGYLVLGGRLLSGDTEYEGAWNFGPNAEDFQNVKSVLEMIQRYVPDLRWHATKNSHNPESSLLFLDNSKSRNKLNWSPVWSIGTAVERTLEWYLDYIKKGTVGTSGQLRDYVEAAHKAKKCWVKK